MYLIGHEIWCFYDVLVMHCSINSLQIAPIEGEVSASILLIMILNLQQIYCKSVTNRTEIYLPIEFICLPLRNNLGKNQPNINVVDT